MSEGVNSARSDLRGGAGWIGFGLLIVGESLRMDRYTSMGATIYTMPGFVPGMIGAVQVLLGAALMLRGRNRLRAKEEAGDTAPDDGGIAQWLNRRVIITLALSLTYAAILIGRIPFWLATGLFVASFTALFAPEGQPLPRRLLAAVVAGVLTSLIVTLVFERVFYVRMP